MNVLVAIDKLSLDSVTPSCIALNLRDTRNLFREAGVRLTVCTLRAQDPGADLLEEAGLPVARLGLSPYSPRVYAALYGEVRRCRADLLHAHGYAAANFGRMVGRRLGLPVAIHEHAVLRVQPHQFCMDWLCRKWTARGLAASRAVADFMVRGRCVPRERVRVVYNGIDIGRFSDPGGGTREDSRRGFGWPAQGPLIGCAARFRREKGLHVLLAAAPLVLAQCPAAHFVLAGEGPERDGLILEAARRGLRERVFFPGFIADMPGFLRAQTLLAIPSLSEGLSFAALEAMAAGTPVVASRVGGLPEIIADGSNGVLCPPGNAKALADAILSLLRNPARLSELAQEGRQVAQRYGMDRYVASLADCYRELTGIRTRDEAPDGHSRHD